MTDEQASAPSEKPVEQAAQEPTQDRWDELFAKIDAITETLRKACEAVEQQAKAPVQQSPAEPAAN